MDANQVSTVRQVNFFLSHFGNLLCELNEPYFLEVRTLADFSGLHLHPLPWLNVFVVFARGHAGGSC